jgi:phospholipase C
MKIRTTLIAMAVVVSTVTSWGQDGATPTGAGRSKINHVVIVFQENRSTDNLFHDQVLMNRGADIATYGYTRDNQKVKLTPVPLVTSYDLGHSHDTFVDQCQWDGTKCVMNGAPTLAFQYVRASDVQPYFIMAETYTFGDRMFQTNEGASFAAHQYIISGSSAVCVPGAPCPPSTTSKSYVVDNVHDNQRAAGCLAPPGSVTNTIDTSRSFPNVIYTPVIGPACFEHPTLTDLLDHRGLTWKYYAPVAGSIWTSPNVIKHMCVPVTQRGKETVCSGPDWTDPNPNVVIEAGRAKVVTDIQNGQLAAVTWVIPSGPASDHPTTNLGLGPSWVASIVNAIGESPFWADTAIIITWDDWGGWFDHVPPPIRNHVPPLNSYEYGFRVPLIVISPYAKPQYVSHQPNDFGSILKFIEETFSLPQIGQSVGVEYADSYALGDLSDCFNFNQKPLVFRPIPARYSKEYFLHNKAKPTPPDTY